MSLESGARRCTCGQIFKFGSQRELDMRCRLHLRFCTIPPIGTIEGGVSRGEFTIKEQMVNQAERMFKV